MSEVERPDGHELRSARASKSGTCTDWAPQDALFAASQQIKAMDASGERKVDAVLVLFRSREADGTTQVHLAVAGPTNSSAALLVRGLQELG